MKGKRVNNYSITYMITVLSLFSIVISACNSADKTASTSKGPDPAKLNATAEIAKKGNISVAIYDRGAVPAAEGTVEKNRWTDWINEKGPANVKFVAIPRWESVQKYNTLFASGTAPDLILEFDTDYRNELWLQKQLMPLDDLIEKYSTTYKELMKKNPLLAKLGRKPDGKIYEVGQLLQPGTNHAYYIRQDWLKKLGLEIPKTTEELYQVAKAFAERDPDGNGKKDTFGTSLSFVSGMIVDHMFQNVEWVVENGQLVRDWDRAKAATEFKKKLYDEGIIDKDYLVDKNGAKAEQDWVNGKLGIWGSNNGTTQIGYKVFETLKKNDPTADIWPIELPRSAFGQFTSYINVPARTLGAINVKAKDPAVVMKYIDFIVGKEYSLTMKNGIEGVQYKNGSTGCPEFLSEEAKKQVEYLGDYNMLSSASVLYDAECASFANKLDPNKPIDKEFLKFIEAADKAYVNKDRPYPRFTHHATLPAVPKEIKLIESSANKTMVDIWVKAIVSGSAYSVDQAVKDAKNVWEKAGGKQTEEWYKKWYTENKDTAFLTKDIYETK